MVIIGRAGASPPSRATGAIFLYVVVITPFGVLLLIYKGDAPRARKRPRARPCKPQQHDKRCDN